MRLHTFFWLATVRHGAPSTQVKYIANMSDFNITNRGVTSSAYGLMMRFHFT